MFPAKIKIVFVITSTGVGGAEKMLYHTITGLDPARYSVSLCSLKEKGVYARALEEKGIEVYCPGMSKGNSITGWFESLRAVVLLFLYFKKERPTIVHSFLFRANIIARIAAFCASVPIIICSVRVMGGERGYYHLVERLTSWMVDHYTAVSGQVKRYIVGRAGVPERKISTIENGVAFINGSAGRTTACMDFPGINPGDRIVVTAGRLHPQKGFDCLMKAMVLVHRSFPAVKLLILGEGDEENNLKNLAQSLELKGKVILGGLCTDPATVLSCADLFVLPSRWEGMPNVILEAMAAGKPVVATAVGGIPELVVPGVTGVLVPPDNAEQLAHAIEGLLRDAAGARAMGVTGRERVRQHFSIAAMMHKTDNLYQELLRGTRVT